MKAATSMRMNASCTVVILAIGASAIGGCVFDGIAYPQGFRR